MTSPGNTLMPAGKRMYVHCCWWCGQRYRPAIPNVRYSESPLCRYAPQC